MTKNKKEFTLWINKYLMFNNTIKNRIKAWCKQNDYPAYLFANRAFRDHMGVVLRDREFTPEVYRKLSAKLTASGTNICKFISGAILNQARLHSIITDEEYNKEVKNVEDK